MEREMLKAKKQMTIEEVIKHERQVSKINKNITKHPALHNNDEDEINACLECAEYHEQLVEWLEELKEYRIDCNSFFGKGLNEGYNEGYTKAIDDFSKAEDYLMNKIKEETADVNIDFEWRKVVCLDDIRKMLHQGLCEVAEQLKEGTLDNEKLE